MRLEINRTKRDPKEGIALNVSANDHDEDGHWQFKIDIWSIQGRGQYLMRLDGFCYLRLWQADRIQELYMCSSHAPPGTTRIDPPPPSFVQAQSQQQACASPSPSPTQVRGALPVGENTPQRVRARS